MSKIGRNELCWCGSGKKYKKCHLNRENEAKKNIYEIKNNFKTIFNEPACMAPNEIKNECSEKIIKAHTISKSSNLKYIAENGHVWHLSLDSDERKIDIIKDNIGINKASTLKCFCSKHDKELFSEIEDKAFSFSDKQIFLLTYRSLCAELYKKNLSKKHMVKSKEYDSGFNVAEQLNFQIFLKNIIYAEELGVRDLIDEKECYDCMLINEQFDDIRYYCIIFEKPLDIYCSGGFVPTIDFNNNSLANLYDEDKIFYRIFINIIKVKDNGVVIFSWHKNQDQYCLALIKSLIAIPDIDKPAALLCLFFKTLENIFFSDSWWSSLSTQKHTLLKEYFKTFLVDNLQDYSKLKEFVDWKIIKSLNKF